jgi:predicted GNAT superfamily acetyltransferase
MKKISLHILETPQEMAAAEELQRRVWPGTDRDAVPHHLLLAAAQNGGLVIGAVEYDAPDGEADLPAAGAQPALGAQPTVGAQPSVGAQPTVGAQPSAWEGTFIDRTSSPEQVELVGFVFGFLGLYQTPEGARLKHCSHMLGVLPEFRERGVGFLLKRAQWQMVHHQGLELITWTYDPLLSVNAHLNIARLGGVCKTYLPNAYGEMSDALNAGLPSDRFEVDWWINSRRVLRRMSKSAPTPLDLAHYLAADTPIINPSQLGGDNLPHPNEGKALDQVSGQALLLVEIPADFLKLKAADRGLARAWRFHTRELFEGLFRMGYLATDALYLAGATPRSFYVLTNGEAEIMGVKKGG